MLVDELLLDGLEVEEEEDELEGELEVVGREEDDEDELGEELVVTEGRELDEDGELEELEVEGREDEDELGEVRVTVGWVAVGRLAGA
ncbi:MAG: hypothetical protein Q8N13_20530 [Acidovorax sp.]|nr:hypothetical protein [Acidovorax sp.]